MLLSQFIAQKRRKIFEDLLQGGVPSEGIYSDVILNMGRSKGAPRMGGVIYQPTKIGFEYVFTDSNGGAEILVVELDAPERIVFLPVPEWVVESVWQGEVSGAFHFEKDVIEYMYRLKEQIAPRENAKYFNREMPMNRS